jgi:hypothetical protein
MFLGSKVRLVRRPDNLTAIYELIGLQGLLWDSFTFDLIV